MTQYTDPMCVWCWGSEPIVRHLRVAYGRQVRIKYVMGGLIEDFEQFHDAKNDIPEPGDVAPHRLEASEIHGMPVDTGIFEVDPARSTYPASVAFVAARQRDSKLAHQYLRSLREAYTTQVRNVNNREVQVELAASVGLDVDKFTTALDDGTARSEFRVDLSRTRRAGVRAFPTYRIDGPDGRRQVAGFQSFEDIATDQLAAHVPDRPLETNVEFYTALLLNGIGIPKELFTATFALSRIGGWMAHALEQLDDNHLIRPSARYVGDTGRSWTPIEDR